MSLDPYRAWLHIPKGKRPPDYYQLLGLSKTEELDESRVHEAARERYDHVRKYTLGPHGELAQRILGEISQAVDCLSDPDKRAAYDRRLEREPGTRGQDEVLAPIAAEVDPMDLPADVDAPGIPLPRQAKEAPPAPLYGKAVGPFRSLDGWFRRRAGRGKAGGENKTLYWGLWTGAVLLATMPLVAMAVAVAALVTGSKQDAPAQASADPDAWATRPILAVPPPPDEKDAAEVPPPPPSEASPPDASPSPPGPASAEPVSPEPPSSAPESAEPEPAASPDGPPVEPAGSPRLSEEVEGLFGFEDGSEGWSVVDWYAGPGVGHIEESAERASQGQRSLKVTSPYLEVMKFMDWSDYDFVACDLYASPRVPPGVRVKVHLAVGGTWELVRTDRAFPLVPGEWVTVQVDLRPGSQDWDTVVDDAFRRDVRKVAIEFLPGDQTGDGQGPAGPFRPAGVYLDNIRGIVAGAPPPEAGRVAGEEGGEGMPPGPGPQAVPATWQWDLAAELRVNDHTASKQLYPSLALLKDGRVLVAWVSWGQPSGSGCWGKLFSSDGSALGREFLLNPLNHSGWEYGPAMAPLPDGGFAVAWGDTSTEVRLQRFGADMKPKGRDSQVTPIDVWPAVSSSPKGGFVVTWGRTGREIGARCYDGNAGPLGAAWRVNGEALGYTKDFMTLSNAAHAPDGRFIVVWSDGHGQLRARRYRAHDAPLGAELVLTSPGGTNPYYPTSAYTSAGDVVIAWHGKPSGEPEDVFAQRLGADGTPLGGPRRVNDITAGRQTRPNLAVGPSDEFAICWKNNQGGDWDVFARVFGAEGQALGPEFRVHEPSRGNQELSPKGGRHSVALVGDKLFVTWYGDGPGDDEGVFLSVLTQSDAARTRASEPPARPKRRPHSKR